MFRKEVERLCRLLQIVDFRPLFIAPVLGCLNAVLNVNQQGNAALCLWSFDASGASALYSFSYGFLCIICAEGFQTGISFLPRHQTGHILSPFNLIACRFQTGQQFFKTGNLRNEGVNGCL